MVLVFPFWTRFKDEFLYKKCLFQLLPCLSPLVLSFRNKNGCKSRCSEWQEGHTSRHLPPVLPKGIQGRLCWGQLLRAARAWLWALADRKIPRVGFMQLNKLNKKTRRQSTQMVIEAYCFACATKVLQGSVLGGGSTQVEFVDTFLKCCKEDSPQGIPRGFMPRGSSASRWLSRVLSLQWPSSSHLGLFPLIVLRWAM